MKRQAKRIVWQVIGVVVLLFGLVGFFLPILQGALFTLVGLFILSMTSERVKVFLHRIRDSFPRYKDRIVAIEEKLEKKIGHWFKD